MADESDTESRFQAPPVGPTSGPTATLATTRIGRGGRVHDVRGEDAVSLRLLEMGLTPGVPVRVVAQALLGDPLEVEVRGYRLSIRRAEAARVAVDPD
jgi:ferrous iron transport protein A